MTNTETTKQKLSIHCNSCGKSKDVKPTPKGNPRPPIGWRVVADETLCKACFADQWMTVAVTIPVLSPKALWETMSDQWAETTALANWALDRLIENDITRTPEMKKLPAMPKVYLYGLAKDEYPRWGILPAAASLAVLRRVEQDWRSDRYQVLWTYERSRRVYHYAQPYSTGDFRLATVTHEGDQRLSVQAKIGPSRQTLILSREKGFRRQRQTLQKVLDGPLGKDACTELTLYRRKANSGDHRESAEGEKQQRWRIFAKICVLLPRTKSKEAKGTLIVKTHADSLIEALDTKGERIWWYHGDHARRIVSKHEAHLSRLQRLSDDRKHEKRKPKKQGEGFRQMLGDVSHKDAKRIQQIADEAAASVVAFAARRKYAALEYDDSERSFAHNFRWHMLREKIKTKCHMNGIDFIERSGDEEDSATARKRKKRGNANE